MINRKILLNPGPGTTSELVKQALLVPDICPREEEFCSVMNTIKEDLPRIANGKDEYTAVLFAASGTGAVEAAITSAVPNDGMLCVIENGAYGTRMCQIAESFNIPLVKYSLPYGDYPDLEAIRRILDKNPGVTHVGVVDHETTTGMRNPVQDICDLAHARQIETIVDCMSSFAGIPIDLQAWKAEYIISSSNKCLQGMPGLSFVIFRTRLLDAIRKNRRSFYFNLYAQYEGFRHTGQMPFTPPVQVVYALRTALDLLFSETVPGRFARYRANYELLCNGMKSLGFEFLLPREYQSGILLAVLEPTWPGYSFKNMHDWLYRRGFTIYPGKGAKEATFRLSILGDLYQNDIHSFLTALAEYLKEFK